MAKPLASDELWEIVPPLLPAPKPRRFRNQGRQPLDDRAGGVPLGDGANPGWLHQFRRLRVRYERRADIYEAFLSLGCSIICFLCLTSFC